MKRRVTTRTMEEKKTIVDTIQAKIKNGMRAGKAIDESGVNHANYYDWVKKFAKPSGATVIAYAPTQKSPSAYKTKKANANSKLALLIGSPDQIAEFMRNQL